MNKSLITDALAELDAVQSSTVDPTITQKIAIVGGGINGASQIVNAQMIAQHPESHMTVGETLHDDDQLPEMSPCSAAAGLGHGLSGHVLASKHHPELYTHPPLETAPTFPVLDDPSDEAPVLTDAEAIQLAGEIDADHRLQVDSLKDVVPKKKTVGSKVASLFAPITDPDMGAVTRHMLIKKQKKLQRKFKRYLKAQSQQY